MEPNSYEFSSLEPFSAYEAQIRCIPEDRKGFWSDWSPPLTFRTPEDAPQGLVDVWQAAGPPEPGQPSLLLLWKVRPVRVCRGRVEASRGVSPGYQRGTAGSFLLVPSDWLLSAVT
nr:granulocyte colony-stimulating factor receptor-like [Pelodiscus sinensis]|eukprot:XP_014424356.1 granulocyte colony-stimulating factor receptor-like [Pelodiscus sinensis]